MRRVVVALVVLAGTVTHASGFALANQSARATGMGNAFVAVGDDASSVFFNPAGLAAGSTRFSVEAGDTVIAPSVTFTSPSGATTTSELELSPPPHLYARFAATDRLSVGVGVFSPFGASVKWPDGWDGASLAEQSHLATYALEPAMAFAISPRVRFGAGVAVLRGTVLLQRAIDYPDEPGTLLLGGSAWGVGFHAGVQAKLWGDYLDVGAAWRSGAGLNFEGVAHFGGVPPELADTLKDQHVSTHLDLPNVISLGVASRPIPRLHLALDGRLTTWSQFQHLEVEFDDPSLSTSTPKTWHNTVSAHLGGEFELTKAAVLRAGLAFDPGASPEDTLTPDLPDATRLELSVGGGYQFSSFRVDAAYQLVLLTAAPSTAEAFPGTYGGLAHVVAVSVSFAGPPRQP